MTVRPEMSHDAREPWWAAYDPAPGSGNAPATNAWSTVPIDRSDASPTLLYFACNPAVQRKTPMLFVHGICHGAWCWSQHYMPFFAARGHPCFALDLSDAAEPSSLLTRSSPDLDTYLVRLTAALRLFDEPVIVVGHSMGAALARLAILRDAPMAAVVLLAPMVPGSLTLAETIRLCRNVARLMAFVRLLAGASLSAQSINELPFFDRRLTIEDASRYSRYLRGESRRAILELLTFDVAQGRLPMPSLVIGSKADSIFGESALTRTAQRYHSSLIVMETGAHDLMLDPTWQLSADLIGTWLDDNVPE